MREIPLVVISDLAPNVTVAVQRRAVLLVVPFFAVEPASHGQALQLLSSEACHLLRWVSDGLSCYGWWCKDTISEVPLVAVLGEGVKAGVQRVPLSPRPVEPATSLLTIS